MEPWLWILFGTVLFVAGMIAGYALGLRKVRQRSVFRPRHYAVDRLARRDSRRQQEGAATVLHAEVAPRAHVRLAHFARVEGTDIARRTGRIRDPEEPVR